jgi:hypothetical protein
MILRIARRELLAMRRDDRFRTAVIAMKVPLSVSVRFTAYPVA